MDYTSELMRANWLDRSLSLKLDWPTLLSPSAFESLSAPLIVAEMIHLCRIDMSDPEGTYNKYNSTSLRTLFPSISLGDYFAGYSPRSYPDPVIVTSPAYVEKLVEILADEEDDVLESYFVFRMAQSVSRLPCPV